MIPGRRPTFSDSGGMAVPPFESQVCRPAVTLGRPGTGSCLEWATSKGPLRTPEYFTSSIGCVPCPQRLHARMCRGRPDPPALSNWHAGPGGLGITHFDRSAAPGHGVTGPGWGLAARVVYGRGPSDWVGSGGENLPMGPLALVSL
jgi:hypothetical protein